MQLNTNWPGRLPATLTKLVIAPDDMWESERLTTAQGTCRGFLNTHLPALTQLRHLAIHDSRCLQHDACLLPLLRRCGTAAAAAQPAPGAQC